MKKHLVRLLAVVAVMLTTADGFAQVADPDFKGIKAILGYEIVKDIAVSRSKNASAAHDMTIKSGRVCTSLQSSVNDPEEQYGFELIDCCEYIVLGKSYVKYYEPAQDDVPARYARREAFNQATKKVYVYTAAPHSWQEGEVFRLIPKANNDSQSEITIKPVVIKDKNAVYIIQDDSLTSKLSMYDKTIYELTYYNEDGTTYRTYSFNGRELAANRYDEQDDHWWSMGELMVDNDGYCHAKDYDENASFEPWSELGEVSGEYPGIGLVGWLSATRMVIDDCIYDVVK